MSSDLPTGFQTELLPVHVAIIMDGNGRWAKKRLMNRVKGHERGSETVRSVVRTTRKLGIPYLSLYAFSTENWERPKTEVATLMSLLRRFLASEREEMLGNNIRLNAIGELDRLPATVRSDLEAMMVETAGNNGMVLTLCLSYGSRDELTEAMRAVAIKVTQGLLDPASLSSDDIARHLYTADLPDPDLLIRTSGELRLSNFMLWQLAYTEFVFSPTLWPDFTKEEYLEILKMFQERDRRFGRVNDT
ncbi:isoprenyl transferase [Desulfobotulus sp. H1]|uniref:Isoprenyl transferase n=1 Tax=Desulfobotulus pelophilus TaxID=2823377 RepID=A0ABT3N5B4_9BACT|nr:isoprenyl transferase [Desulfobotulus pelophilus]MCW7752644.1 isoprenyl transferase [Desulfobotulus pelophilus]